MDVVTPEEIAAADPFQGSGRRIARPPGLSEEQAQEWIRHLWGEEGWVLFPSCAWVDVNLLVGR